MKKIMKMWEVLWEALKIIWKVFWLLLIGKITLSLISFELAGLHFGIIALICWVLAFWDIQTINLKNFGITFWTKKQTLPTPKRELYQLCLDKLKKSILEEIPENGYATPKALHDTDEAYEIASFYLPDDLRKEIEKIQQKIKEAYIIHRRWKTASLENNENVKNFSEQENKILEEIENINLCDIFRPYLKIKD